MPASAQLEAPAPARPTLRMPATRQRFRKHAGWILKTAQIIGCKSGLAEADARDFAGWVALRMMRRNYAVLRKCRDPRRLRGYLAIAIRNLAKDYRNHLWGKWRPTTTARELGPYGVELEKLCVRDGFSPAEAIDFLRFNRPLGPSTEQLEDMVGCLPLRPRRSQVEFDAQILGRRVAVEPEPASFEARRARQTIRTELATALRTLDEGDRELLACLFDDGRSVASIAREQDLDQRALYSRRDRCLRRLRELLEEQGVVWPDVAFALEAADHPSEGTRPACVG